MLTGRERVDTSGLISSWQERAGPILIASRRARHGNKSGYQDLALERWDVHRSHARPANSPVSV
jgi:hypothetical protein